MLSSLNLVGLLGKSTVRIPLDYYRILGLPILATADQVQQSHRDRTLQLPRPEFSTHAVAARKALLNQAFEVLSHEEKRREYDARFLASTYEPAPGADPSEKSDTQHSDIEVEETQLVGGLLLLQELGEYESVLRLGRPYLKPGHSSLKENGLGDPAAAESDVVLVVTLACLELGREEWQQGSYDNAAAALETGQDLLLREGMFPAVRAEVQADLYKLRPYRILAMLSDPDEDSDDRDKGLAMLQEMLNERHGIDGRGIDQSGLGVDDFLRFIQQLRDYMTVDEQQVLFEAEARRPSAVATYLAVYALLAKGFARQEPALIRRAKAMLMRLGSRQDVYLEQSICSLLLGQPEIAAKALERSQEYEPLAFIRENSQGSSDLLPGLCLYTERWMQEEVFPHFRDLATQTASLKDYFANPQVQSYLEELPNETELAVNQTAGQFAPIHWSGANPSQPLANFPSNSDGASVGRASTGKASTGRASTGKASGKSPNDRRPKTASRHDPAWDESRGPGAADELEFGAIGTAAALGGAAALSGTVAASLAHNSLPEGTVPAPRNGQRRGRRAEGRSDGRIAADGTMMTPSLDADGVILDAPQPNGRAIVRPQNGQRPGWFWPAILFLTGLIGYTLVQCVGQQNRSPRAVSSSSPTIPSGELLISLDQPLLALPGDAVESTGGVQGEMNPATAKQVLELWFSAKKAAMGSAHEIDRLNAVLTGDKLSKWREEAIGAKGENLTIAYEHGVEVSNVEVSKENPNEASVTANVREQRKYTKDGQPLEDQTDDLPLTYTFVRENNQWKIKNW